MDHPFHRTVSLHSLSSDLLTAQGILTNVPNGGLGGFYTLIVNQMGFTKKETTLLNMVNGVVAQSLLLFFSWLAARTGRYSLTAEGAIASESQVRGNVPRR